MESMGHGGVALIVTWTCVYTCAVFFSFASKQNAWRAIHCMQSGVLSAPV